MRDPFSHARVAGLLALAATIDVFTEEDCAGKILPAICPSLLDQEKYEVRLIIGVSIN
jgi:SCY1-like protein 1